MIVDQSSERFTKATRRNRTNHERSAKEVRQSFEHVGHKHDGLKKEKAPAVRERPRSEEEVA